MGPSLDGVEASPEKVPEAVGEARIRYGRGHIPEGTKANLILYSYCPASGCGKEPRYFQEVAVNRVLQRIMQGQRRLLLAMATGTGKTFVAFQIVWKLVKSGWLRRVLFLAEAYVHMKREVKTIKDYETLQRRTFFGQEKKPIPTLLGVMNLVLHGVLTPNVVRRNTEELTASILTKEQRIAELLEDVQALLEGGNEPAS